MSRLLRHLLWLVALVAMPALADTRASLSRDAVALGESVILTIDTDQPVASPDLRPLRADFDVGNVDNARQFSIDGGHVRASQRIRVELRPRRAGTLTLPVLTIGNQRTPPLLLQVSSADSAASATSSTPSQTGSDPAQNSGPVFIDTVIDDDTPHVQQSVGVTVRLHYAINLYNGELAQLPPSHGGSLQPIGNDSRSVRVIDGREYRVLERHYLLIPERSGVLRLPGATFRGEGQSGFFGGLFGDGRDALSAQAPTRTLQVQPIPAGAGASWLPARSMTLRVASPPNKARAGEAIDIVVELRADGVTAAQLPELQLEGADAQIFAEPAQPTENFADGRPNVVLTRRFSVVPQHAGALRLQLAPIDWWDVGSDAPRQAQLAPIDLQVTPGAGRYAQDAAGTGASPQTSDTNTDATSSNPGAWLKRIGDGWWAIGGLLFACGVLMIGWLRRRASNHESDDAGMHARDAIDADGGRITRTRPPHSEVASPHARAQSDTHKQRMADFRLAIERGDLAEVARLLPLLAAPPLATLAEARAQLDDPAQRDALAQLERVLWAAGDADAEAVRANLRRAFVRGPRWRGAAKPGKPLLPPLYPER